MFFENIYEEWKIYVKSRHKKQGFETIARNFKLHVLKYFKNYNINELTIQDILNWQNTILLKNFSNSFNNSIYVAFNSFLNYCCTYKNLEKNLLSEIGNFPEKIEQKKETKFYTLNQFKYYIKNVDEIIYKRCIETMYWAGSRPSETLAFRFSDLKKYELDVNFNLERRGDRNLTTPKSKSSIRKIPIDKILYYKLLKLKKMYIKEFGNKSFDYFIFGGIEPLSTSTLDRKIEKASIKAHIFKLKPHEFRHSHASLLANLGVPIKIIQERLGHANLSTTEIYIHSFKEQEKKLTKKLFFLHFDFFETIAKNFKKINIFKRLHV